MALVSLSRSRAVAASALVALSVFLPVAPARAQGQNVTISLGLGFGIAIPDGDATGIDLTGNPALTGILTEVRSFSVTAITHDWVGDLTLTLSGGGRSVDILDRAPANEPGGFGDGSRLGGTYTFVPFGGADFATTPRLPSGHVPTGPSYATVPVGVPNPLNGTSPADGSLADFEGRPISGAWGLKVQDRVTGFTGRLEGWQLRFVVNGNLKVDGATGRTVSDATYAGLPGIHVGSRETGELTLARGAEVPNVTLFRESRLFMNGGNATGVTAKDDATAFINAGSVGTVTAEGNGTAYVLDGTFSDLVATGQGDIYVYGGSIGPDTLSVYGDGQIHLYGAGLSLDFSSGLAGVDAQGNAGTFYNLTGTLTDGAPLNTRLFDADGGRTLSRENGALFFNNVSVANAAPEPASGALLALAGLAGALARRRKGARRGA